MNLIHSQYIIPNSNNNTINIYRNINQNEIMGPGAEIISKIRNYYAGSNKAFKLAALIYRASTI